MDPNNYVAPAPGGGFIVVKNGSPQGTYASQAEAENAFNGGGGGGAPPAGGGQVYQTPNGPKTLAEMQAGLQGAGWNGNYNDPAAVIAAYNSTASGSSSGGASTASASQKLLDAIASGDQAKFDEAVKEFDQNFAENKRQFDASSAEKAREFDTSNYTNLGTTLLNTAANLRGPKDYYQFQQFTSGGRDLMSQLYGNQPRPDFSAPTGPIEPETVADLMAKLGFTTSPISGVANAVGAQPPTANTPTPGMYTTVNGPRTVDQMYQELRTAGWGGSATDTNAIVAAYQQTTGNPVTPQAANTVAPNAATPNTLGNNNLAPNSANSLTHSPSTAAPTGQQTVTPISGGFPTLQLPSGNQTITPISGALAPLKPQTGDSGGGQTPMGASFPSLPPPKVPLPYQINPAVYDSLGSVGQGLLQSAAESQGWDWNEYLRQLNASRPKGTAPGATTTNFATPMGSFA